MPDAFAFDPLTGELVSIPQDKESAPLQGAGLATSLDEARRLHVVVNRTGRPTVCAPSGSTVSEPPC
jgi:hypothetical protein